MWDDFTSWAKQPFSSDMSALGWFAFIGLLLAIAVGWNLILGTVKEVT